MKEPYIVFDRVSFQYPRGKFALQEICVSFFCGEITIIHGANGSGKSTLAQLAAGILKPDSGTIRIGGEAGLPLWEIGRRIGFCFQNPTRQLFAMTVAEEIGFPLTLRGLAPEAVAAVVNEMLLRFDLVGLAEHFPLRLSRGEQQRLVMAAVAAQSPAFYLVDEPATGLDREHKDAAYGYLRELAEEGKGVAAVSHDGDFIAASGDHVIAMEKGRVKADER